jgi:DNA modification methylase
MTEDKLKQHLSIKLSNESCFDFLKRLENDSISLILIDPPYEISRNTNFCFR